MKKNGLGHNHFSSIKGGTSSDMLMENDSVDLKLHLLVDVKLAPTFSACTYVIANTFIFSIPHLNIGCKDCFR